jgi:hypothetical protein
VLFEGEHHGPRSASADSGVLGRAVFEQLPMNENPTEGGSPRKRQADLEFFETLESGHDDEVRLGVVAKPMRGGLSRGRPRLEGRNPRRDEWL